MKKLFSYDDVIDIVKKVADLTRSYKSDRSAIVEMAKDTAIMVLREDYDAYNTSKKEDCDKTENRKIGYAKLVLSSKRQNSNFQTQLQLYDHTNGAGLLKGYVSLIYAQGNDKECHKQINDCDNLYMLNKEEAKKIIRFLQMSFNI